MGRKRLGERFLGPYRSGDEWRVAHYGADGSRQDACFPTEREARLFKEAGERELVSVSSITEAIKEYGQHLADKGNKPVSVEAITRRVTLFLEPFDSLASLSPKRCEARYKSLRDARKPKKDTPLYAVATHRQFLGDTKAFLAWAVKMGWLRANPLAEVRGVGRKKKGKPQLRVDEARAWEALAFAWAGAGREGGLAALLAFYLGLRASEVVKLQVRDLDDDGRLLWITDTKTEAGRRKLVVPERLRPLLKAKAEGKKPVDRLFTCRTRQWLWKQVRKLCDTAGVPKIPTHGLRGTAASIATEAGEIGTLIAASLGHVSYATTLDAYARPDAVAAARHGAIFRVLQGGKEILAETSPTENGTSAQNK